MKIKKINAKTAVEHVEQLLAEEKHISPALKAALNLLLILVQAMIDKLGLDSQNSSKPPSSDPNRKKTDKKKNGRRPGGQKGHIGKQLKPFDTPSRIAGPLIFVKLSRTILSNCVQLSISFILLFPDKNNMIIYKVCEKYIFLRLHPFI